MNTTEQSVSVEGPHAIATSHAACCDYRSTGVPCAGGEDMGPRVWLTIAVDGESVMLHVDNLAALHQALARVLP